MPLHEYAIATISMLVSGGIVWFIASGRAWTYLTQRFRRGLRHAQHTAQQEAQQDAVASDGDRQ